MYSTSYFLLSFCFFFNDTATTEIYTLSLHDALPIELIRPEAIEFGCGTIAAAARFARKIGRAPSELQSRVELVCRLLLEKKKKCVPWVSRSKTLDILFETSLVLRVEV